MVLIVISADMGSSDDSILMEFENCVVLNLNIVKVLEIVYKIN